jgi:NAD(P)-dependent dehydrogenase (short-subunit alcohol dehydrogenase family)
MEPGDWETSEALPLVLPDLRGKVALVTGSSRGIGRAVVGRLREQGTRCFGLANDPQAADAEEGYEPLRCDLADAKDLERCLGVLGDWTDHLDYLVNVAGIDPKVSIDEGDAKRWDAIVNVNLRGYYLLIRGTLPLLRAGTGRSIVNVSSINYRLGIPGRSIYSTTKAGILGLTTGLARELGREGIRINTVSPGWVFTERQVEEYFTGPEAAKHFATLEQVQAVKLQIRAADVANHILFYLSAASRASTGHNCVVDAGWLLE